MTAFDRDNLQLIFSALVDWWMRKFSYGQNINKLAKGLVGAPLEAALQSHHLSLSIIMSLLHLRR